eukprot:TRINITY_DN17018_c0_g1_i1.p2 TRINITY_DN17018_c0_g1~~TRINITY_DN17018_c0_g1_i1.p2  ORF type:complete len:240 (-),score=70.33 TRINITY_DN17018_c0_g1_i1:41-760(-)
MAVAQGPRLANGECVRAFLAGRWSFKRKINYRVGGGQGFMVGEATFTEASKLPSALLYEERGSVQFDHLPRPMEASRRYCFNTGVWPPEVYFVNDPAYKHRETLLPELDIHTSFFVPLPFAAAPGDAAAASDAAAIDGTPAGAVATSSAAEAGAASAAAGGDAGVGGDAAPATVASCASCAARFEHLCIEDLYTGELAVTGEDSFEWRWRVVGPGKDGEIEGVYTRACAGAGSSDGGAG